MTDRYAELIAYEREHNPLPEGVSVVFRPPPAVLPAKTPQPRQAPTTVCSCGVVFRSRSYGARRKKYHALDCPDLPKAHRYGRSHTKRDSRGRWIS